MHLGQFQCCSFRLVEKYGEGQWSLISTFFPGRIGKQCRERWHHQLNPKINRNAWSVEEERIIVAAHKVRVPRQGINSVPTQIRLVPMSSELMMHTCAAVLLR